MLGQLLMEHFMRGLFCFPKICSMSNTYYRSIDISPAATGTGMLIIQVVTSDGAYGIPIPLTFYGSTIFFSSVFLSFLLLQEV
jgi:hypothetical protein